MLIPGVIGGVAGANLLTSIDGNVIKPYNSAYLLIIGAIILVKAFRNPTPSDGKHGAHFSLLGLVGGFFDAIGGGWGLLVTTTLVARGDHPRFSSAASISQSSSSPLLNQ